VKILHLSDTTLSGSPIRLSKLLQKCGGVESRHLVWTPTVGYRTFETDLVGREMQRDDLHHWIYEWADIIHYHNRWRRQEVFQFLGSPPPKKKAVIQIHSPRHEGESFEDEARSSIPLAIIAQFHVREWPEASFVVPNVVDIEAPEYRRIQPGLSKIPVVSYAPSNWNAKGWNDKGFPAVAPVLKKMKLENFIRYQQIVSRPHKDVMLLKRLADIGIDEIVTGSYHLSSLEYLSLGVPCFANLDDETTSVVKELTGADTLPWLKADKASFPRILRELVKSQMWQVYGDRSRAWMETHWSPAFLVSQYRELYESL